jgi:methyl-accepting chemotaxis protein
MSKLSSLSVAQRFSLLLALCGLAVALPAALLADRVWSDVQNTRQEMNGIGPANALLKTLKLTQQHRGLTAQWLAGRSDAGPTRAAKAAEVGQAIAAAEAELAARGADAGQMNQLFGKARDSWKALLADLDAKRLDGPASFRRHTAAVKELEFALQKVTEHWGLLFDPVPSDYMMIVGSLQETPFELELIAQIRGSGASLLAAGGVVPPVERAHFVALSDRLVAQHHRTAHALQRSLQLSSQVRPDLAKAAASIEALGQRAFALAEQHVLQPEKLTYSSTAYYDELTRLVDDGYAAQGALVAGLERSLTDRIAAQQLRLAATVAAVVVLLGMSLGLTLHTRAWLRRSLGAEPGVLAEAARHVAEGDLAHPLAVPAGDRSSVMAAMSHMQQSLARVVGGVRSNANEVAVASGQIAQGNQDLSARTESQASALQQTAASMEELRTTIGHGADSARQASQLATQASDVASRGGAAVGVLAETMQRIQESSKRIADIIGTIDGIAFQTNILALNAAVEAARAGEQGRGFAVVASEVRALAQRSGEAAREIRGLIASSVERVEEGNRQGSHAADTMQEVVQSIRRVSDLIGEVSSAAQEQASGVHQVSEAVTQMDQATQQNAALVEQSAAAAESLRQQADALMRGVSAFRVAHGQ